MTFRDTLYERARRAGRRIVLPEGNDARVREAAKRIESLGIGTVQLLEGTAPRSPLPEMVSLLRSRHPQKFPTDAAATEALQHPLTFGAALVGLQRADVMVGGATFPSGDTIRAALWAVGMAPGISTVSGAFYMVRGDTVLTFTDCAAVPEQSGVVVSGRSYTIAAGVDLESAEALYNKAHALAEAAHDLSLEAMVSQNLGILAATRGRHETRRMFLSPR